MEVQQVCKKGKEEEIKDAGEEFGKVLKERMVYCERKGSWTNAHCFRLFPLICAGVCVFIPRFSLFSRHRFFSGACVFFGA